MKYRNPWIDPRVEQVRPDSAQAYLSNRGWKTLPIEQGSLLPFESPVGEEGPVVRVALKEEARDYPQRVIELITDVALAEDRYAVEVLNDILATAANGTTGNGASASTGKSPTRKHSEVSSPGLAWRETFF
jgi:hypothetical protein